MAEVTFSPLDHNTVEEVKPGHWMKSCTLIGEVARIEGEIVAVWGIVHTTRSWWGFLDLKPPARAYRKTIHARAVRFLAEAKRSGKRYIFVMKDENEPTAERWLKRLGFVDHGGGLYLWRNEACA